MHGHETTWRLGSQRLVQKSVLSKRASSLLLLLGLSLSSDVAAGTFQQVPFTNRLATVNKVTRSFTMNEEHVQRAVFSDLAGGGSFNYYDGSTLVQIVVALDPEWNRLVYSTDVDGDPLRATPG